VSFDACVRQIADGVCQGLCAFRKSSGKEGSRDFLDEVHDGEMFASVIFVGYFEQKPMQASFEVHRDGRELGWRMTNRL
jgi:hypothetical protein